jgi:NAD(P)-dependent dehydrogenase (short-subunit alcohol dehydrogenase family)
MVLTNDVIKREFVVVTGSTGYLGREMVELLVLDYSVIAVSRSASSIEYTRCSARIFPIDLDLNLIDMDLFVSDINDILNVHDGKLVGLVNNAFTYYPTMPMSFDEDTVSNAAQSFLGIHLRLSMAMSGLMQKGSIVNISSMYAHVAPIQAVYTDSSQCNPLLYGAFKSALVQSTKYLSSVLAKEGIRVNSVSFGPFPSEEVKSKDPLFIKRLADRTHLGRVGNSSECSGIIWFLISDLSSYITGTDILVDGGWTAW